MRACTVTDNLVLGFRQWAAKVGAKWVVTPSGKLAVSTGSFELRHTPSRRRFRVVVTELPDADE